MSSQVGVSFILFIYPPNDRLELLEFQNIAQVNEANVVQDVFPLHDTEYTGGIQQNVKTRSAYISQKWSQTAGIYY